jgi:hypothetical protein
VSEIGLVEVSGAVQEPRLVVETPFEVADGRTVTLRFLLSTEDPASLEALRDARRSLLREELTRGRDSDEPSLEDAVFSASEILWEVSPAQRPRCLEKLEELRRRANLLLSEVEPESAGRQR